jgi:hypothetical protein
MIAVSMLRRVLLASLPFAAALSCAKNPSVSLTVNLSGDVATSAKWIEVGIFEGGACPDAKELAGGLPATGYVTRLAFRASDASPPALGDLKKASYAFAAVARADDCSVVGVGCTDADVTSARDVTVVVSPSTNAAAACAAGATCEYARCVPSHDPSAVGAGCSMQLIGAGPLGDSLAMGGTMVSAPAITVTPSGFLVAYREYEPLMGTARLSIIPVDPGGGAGAISATTLPGTCPGSPESDATGLAWGGTTGLAAVSRAACGAAGGVDAFEIDATGAVSKSAFNGGGGVNVTFANAHALAAIPGGYLLAYTQSAETHVATITGLTVQSSAAPQFGGATPQSSGWVATSDKALALVAIGTPAAPIDGGVSDGGTQDGTLRVQIAAAGTNLGALPTPFLGAATFASVAASGTRTLVVSDGSTQGKPLTLRAFDVGGGTPVSSDDFAVPGLGEVLYADVAIAHDRAFVAVEQPGAITLVVYDKATSTPTQLRTVYLPNEPRIPAMTSLRDGRVAVAASDTRVTVVWTTGKTLTDNDPVGGYAIFACAP